MLTCLCEERSDEANQKSLRAQRSKPEVIASAAKQTRSHCEHSEANQKSLRAQRSKPDKGVIND